MNILVIVCIILGIKIFGIKEKEVQSQNQEFK